jgi:hypothetical protein
MKNPWTNKNPFLSMWLSTVNGMFGTARGHAMNEARRQQRLMLSEGARAMLSFWTGAVPSARARKRRSSR